MARNIGNPYWVPGVSGNPAGRPKKNRALTEILTAAGDIRIQVGGKAVARKIVLARLIWELATQGKTTLPDETVLILNPEDWLGLCKWLYVHIDGPPKLEMDIDLEEALILRIEGLDETLDRIYGKDREQPAPQITEGEEEQVIIVEAVEVEQVGDFVDTP